MTYDDERHAVAIGALPALWQTLFRRHIFYGVEIARMADKLATDAASNLACFERNSHIGYCIGNYADLSARERRTLGFPTARATASCWKICTTRTA